MPTRGDQERVATGRLTRVVKELLHEGKAQEYLRQQKEKGGERLARRDFVWFEILLSFATWGNSRGAKRLRFETLDFDCLCQLPKSERTRLIKRELAEAGVRYAKNKAQYLLYNFRLIQKKGGLDAAKALIFKAVGPEEKLKALREYKGVGEKYAYNIMMDAYHPEFHTSIAVDQRIKVISRALGLRLHRYADYATFYQKAAFKLGIQPWEMDRLLYAFRDGILEALQKGPGSGEKQPNSRTSCRTRPETTCSNDLTKSKSATRS